MEISQRNTDKSNKYAHFATDITHINTTVTAFEISSTGNVSSDNKKRLTSLHKFCKSGIKLSTFIKNISSLSIYSSYHIWLCRNDPVFVTPSYLPAPFQPNPTSAAVSTAVRAPGSIWSVLFNHVVFQLFIFLFSTSSLGTWLLQASPVCGPSWIYPWQPTIWVVPCRKPVYYQMFWNKLEHCVMKCQMSWNVKCHEMSNVMKCQMSWNVRWVMSENCCLHVFKSCQNFFLVQKNVCDLIEPL